MRRGGGRGRARGIHIENAIRDGIEYAFKDELVKFIDILAGIVVGSRQAGKNGAKDEDRSHELSEVTLDVEFLFIDDTNHVIY